MCNNNIFDGIDLSTSASSGRMSNFTISNNMCNNNYYGIDLSSNYGRISGFTIFNNTVSNNTSYGINLGSNSGTMTNIDIGGGSLSSPGHNSIFSNNGGTGQINNGSGISNLHAEYNWWGAATPTNTIVYGASAYTVDYSNCLTSNPN